MFLMYPVSTLFVIKRKYRYFIIVYVLDTLNKNFLNTLVPELKITNPPKTGYHYLNNVN